MGGVLIWGTNNHNIRILNSKILFNGKCGIHCVGEDGAPTIESNKIENNSGPGVKVGIANKARVKIYFIIKRKKITLMKKNNRLSEMKSN